MAQIFISHSQRDEKIKNLFFRAFAGTNVTHIFQEYEDVPPTGVTAEIIERNIETSSAVFVLLSENVRDYTRDWILWECGRAKGKPIWVFEPNEAFGKITITIPNFNHYVRFASNDYWRKYIHAIVASYDDTSALGKLGTSGLGAWMFGPWGLALGALVGHVLFESKERPVGNFVACPICSRGFEVHPFGSKNVFRCPGCEATNLTLSNSKRYLM